MVDSVITYDPGAALFIVKDPEGVPEPLVRAQAAFLTGVPEILHVLPAGRKPTPVTVIVSPVVPLEGVRVIAGPNRTMKLASAKSPELPDTRTL